MALVVVERAVEDGESLEAFRQRQLGDSFCFQTHRVRPLRTLRAADKRHWVCFYDAPDAEAVRTTQRAAELPATHIWTALPLIDKQPEVPAGYALSVAQRALPATEITLERVQYLLTDPNGCNRRLHLHQIGAYLALDHSRMICVYHAPDLESVRVSSRELGVPYERVWSGDTLLAKPGSVS